MMILERSWPQRVLWLSALVLPMALGCTGYNSGTGPGANPGTRGQPPPPNADAVHNETAPENEALGGSQH
ncbi:MAG: hypothetical protein IRY99_22270 [Isosphaeraceae bacterium]|nr:hypothetical protein [Isosphaeraceae bacterium]